MIKPQFTVTNTFPLIDDTDLGFSLMRDTAATNDFWCRYADKQNAILNI